MQKVGGPSPLSPTSFHGPGLRATPARTLSRSGSGSELALPAPSVPRSAPSPPDAWPIAGSLRTFRVAECEPSTRNRLPPRSAKPPRFLSNAETRRQRGGARIRFAPPGRDGRSRIRPVLADSAAVPHGPFHQNLRIFLLRFQHFIFLFLPHPARSTPPASLRSAAPSRRGPAGQRTPQGNVARPASFVALPSPSVAHPSRARPASSASSSRAFPARPASTSRPSLRGSPAPVRRAGGGQGRV